MHLRFFLTNGGMYGSIFQIQESGLSDEVIFIDYNFSLEIKNCLKSKKGCYKNRIL